jgi:orc1/cdc6 family replication initiation protein
MITNARALTDEFTPPEVQHRHGEIEHLSATLDPIIQGGHAESSLLYGPSGAGKTCISKHVVDQLTEEVIEINTQYVNAWNDYNRYKCLYRVLEGINETLDIHRQSTPTDELLERVRDYDGPPYVVILDEVDQLEDKRVLYDLYRISNLTMILIANREEDLFSALDDRVRSRLHVSNRIRFAQYDLDQLVSILEDRVRWGLAEDVIETDQLEQIADAAAGDARIAIGILRVAAQRAKQESSPSISDKHIENAIPKARAQVQQKNVEKLSEHQKILFDIIQEEKEVKPKQLYSEYGERADNPKTRRMLRNYLSKMEHYNLITAKGKKRGRIYQIRD